MFSDKQAATEISKLVLECSHMLNEIVVLAAESEDVDLCKIKIAVGTVMADLYECIIRPLYIANPGLKPKDIPIQLE